MIDIINDKRTKGQEPYDLLDMLILAQDEETGEGMSNEQLVDEIITLFAAGHETTASTLTWLYYSLNKYKNIDKIIANFLFQVIGDFVKHKLYIKLMITIINNEKR